MACGQSGYGGRRVEIVEARVLAVCDRSIVVRKRACLNGNEQRVDLMATLDQRGSGVPGTAPSADGEWLAVSYCFGASFLGGVSPVIGRRGHA